MTVRRKFCLLAAAFIAVFCLLTACSGEDGAKGCVDADEYTMNLELDTEEKTLSGTVQIDFTNHTDQNLDRICVRNYAASILENLFVGKSQITKAEAEHTGLEIQVGKDPSIVYMNLKKAGLQLKPGASMALRLTYATDIPEGIDRFGFHEENGKEQYLLTFCFPMLSMYEDGQWNENPYISGATFLFALRDAMGDEAFFQAMREYYQTYCLKEATGEDFLQIIKAADDSERVQKVIDAFLEL